MSETGKGIEITKGDERVINSQNGITIRHEAKPVGDEIIGYAYLVIDCSLSMSEGEKIDQVKNGAKRFTIEAKTKGYLVGLITFNSSATHLCEPQKEISALYRHLESMGAWGSTNMTDAILLATENLIKKNGVRVMVIATDGMPDNQFTALEAAQETKKNGIEIIVIGTDDANQDFLKKLASSAGLGFKVSRTQLGQAVASAAKMLLSKRGG